ncbi:hypothetical protein JCM10213_000709 [Rhodosporidiobolus nylandii]
MATPSLPADLKPISPFLARATELATAEPIISYWCTYYALQQAMSIGSSSAESQGFLLGLMDKLEATKAENATNEAFTDDAAAAAYVENFALKLFAMADNEDRKGKASRVTARKFLAAANFLELLTIFGELSSENRDKVRYAKWKASDIAKAFREGRTPVPGPAGGLSAEEEEREDPASVSKEEAKELSAELAALGTEDRPTPAAEEEEKKEVEGYLFPKQPTALPSVPPTAPDFIDSPPSSPLLARSAEDGEESHAATPAPPSFLDTPVSRPSSALSSASLAAATAAEDLPTVPETHQTSTLQPPSSHLPSEPPAFPSAVFPSAPVLPSAPLPPAPPPPPSAPAPTLPPPPVAAAAAQENYDPATVAKVQKHARWAISALDYEDWETARRELRAALGMLGG